MREVFITTSDNPFDPKTQFEEWRVQDENILHHNSCSFLARVCFTTDSQSKEDITADIEHAIDEIISNEHLYRSPQLYRKVVYEDGVRVQ